MARETTWLRRWWPVVLMVSLPLTCLALVVMRLLFPPDVVPPERFPVVLVPPGGVVGPTIERADETCYAHRIAEVAAVTPEVARRWAAELSLPCATDDAPTSCTSWTTARRTSPFWAPRAEHEPNGLDTVEARLTGTVLRVDWGDYLCSGWN